MKPPPAGFMVAVVKSDTMRIAVIAVVAVTVVHVVLGRVAPRIPGVGSVASSVGAWVG